MVSRPAQIRGQEPFVDQLLNVINALVLRSLEFIEFNLGATIGLVQLFDSAPGCPLRFEIRQFGGDSFAIDAIAAHIRPCIRRVLYSAPRDNIMDYLCQLANLIVLRGCSYVKRAVVHGVAWGFERGEVRSGDVLHMDHRSPRAAIALEIDLLRSKSPGGQIVDN